MNAELVQGLLRDGKQGKRSGSVFRHKEKGCDIEPQPFGILLVELT